MKQGRLAWIAAVSAMTVAPFAPVTAHAADVVPSRTVAPADVTTPSVVKHVNTDVDGDGTRDSVTLTYLGSNQFALTATTTKGKSSSVTFTSVVNAAYAPVGDTWYGASAIDGRKGSELIVNRFTKRTAADRETVTLGVYTWRSGKLVAEKAPASPWGRVWKTDDSQASDARGYEFFTKSGHRYVDATWLKTGKYTVPWKGSVTRSVWRDGNWVKVWTHRVKAIYHSSLSKWGQVGIAGPRLLVGQVNVDVNGDGTSDLNLLYQDGMSHYLVTTTAGSSYGFHSNERYPFIGAAEVDGAAGYEFLLRIDPEDPLWEVLTWSGGKLVPERPAPALYGEPAGTSWRGANDEAVTKIAIKVEGGQHYAVTGWISYEQSMLTDPVNFATSVWQDGTWVKQSEEQRVLTEAERAAFHRGITVDGLVAP